MNPPTDALIRAGALYPVSSPPVAGGWVAVRGGRIAAFGAEPAPSWTEELGRINLPGCCLMPGLINAHCHLDYTAFRGALSARSGFTAWLRDLNALKRSFSDADWLASIRRGIGELVRSGVTTVVNIESFPHLLPRTGNPPVRVIWCVETSDVRHGAGIERLEEILAGPPPAAAVGGGLGISPHAPYTVSARSYLAAKTLAEKHGLLLTTHAAESADEALLFACRKGPLFDLLRPLGCASISHCGATTPLRHLAERCGLASGWLLAHLNELGPGDAEILSAIRPAVVTCPRSGRFFGHTPFPLETVRAAGCRICIGTDSLASNSDLDFFAEMRALAEAHPQLAPAEILRMATLDAAAAIGRPGRIGEIRAGAEADLIALDIGAEACHDPEIAARILGHRGGADWMMTGGRIAGRAGGTGGGSLGRAGCGAAGGAHVK